MSSAPEGEPYSNALPWIGLHIAAASLICTVFMAMDLVHSLVRRKLWIAPKFFTLNAATVTILTVSAQLPSDITTYMYEMSELLAKLSGIILVSVSINHIMPCLSLMDGVVALSSVVALGVLVVSTFVNVYIQIGTGILKDEDDYGIFPAMFKAFTIVMLLKFVVFVSYSLTVTTTKRVLKREYNIKHEKIIQETTPDGTFSDFSVRKMEETLKKYWLMALTSSPDFTFLSSGMCSVSSMLDYSAIVLLIPSFAIIFRGKEELQYSSSDFKWSVQVVFVIQVSAISVGLVGSLLRIANSRPTSDYSGWAAFFRIDKHWVFLLKEWREAPLSICRGLVMRRVRRAILQAKILAVNFLILLQIGVIFLSKFFVFFMRCLWWITIGSAWWILNKYVFPLRCTTGNIVEEDLDLGCLVDYVLRVDEESKNNDIHAVEIVKRWHKYPIRWIKSAKANQPRTLLRFLNDNCTLSMDFEELGQRYDSLLVQPRARSSEGRPLSRCWSLPITTLAAIACTLATPEQKNNVRNLIDSIGEGLKYVRFVEKNLGTSEALKKQEAADVVWEGVNVYNRWLDADLDKMICQDWRTSIRELISIAQGHLNQGNGRKNLNSQSRLLAAACMQDVIKVIRSNTISTEEEGTGMGPLEQLHEIVAYVLGACFVNLPLAVFAQCSSGKFGEREEAVLGAAIVFGETEEIFKWLFENGSVKNFHSAHREKMRLSSFADEDASFSYDE